MLIPVAEAKEGLTQKRQLPKRQRPSDWREVRVGLARPLTQKEQRTYVARMSKYPEVVQQLASAAVDQGLSALEQVYAVADGGNGRSCCTKGTVYQLDIYLRPPASQRASL